MKLNTYTLVGYMGGCFVALSMTGAKPRRRHAWHIYRRSFTQGQTIEEGEKASAAWECMLKVAGWEWVGGRIQCYWQENQIVVPFQNVFLFSGLTGNPWFFSGPKNYRKTT